MGSTSKATRAGVPCQEQGLGQCSFLPFSWPGGAGEAAEGTAQPLEVVGPFQPSLFAWGLLLITRLFI